jgi:hypothetical protein
MPGVVLVARVAVDVVARCLDCGATIENWERIGRRPRSVVFVSDDGKTVHVRKKLACTVCYGDHAEVRYEARTNVVKSTGPVERSVSPLTFVGGGVKRLSSD